MSWDTPCHRGQTAHEGFWRQAGSTLWSWSGWADSPCWRRGYRSSPWRRPESRLAWASLGCSHAATPDNKKGRADRSTWASSLVMALIPLQCGWFPTWKPRVEGHWNGKVFFWGVLPEEKIHREDIGKEMLNLEPLCFHFGHRALHLDPSFRPFLSSYYCLLSILSFSILYPSLL